MNLQNIRNVSKNATGKSHISKMPPGYKLGGIFETEQLTEILANCPLCACLQEHRNGKQPLPSKPQVFSVGKP